MDISICIRGGIRNKSQIEGKNGADYDVRRGKAEM